MELSASLVGASISALEPLKKGRGRSAEGDGSASLSRRVVENRRRSLKKEGIAPFAQLVQALDSMSEEVCRRIWVAEGVGGRAKV